jgi:hypothetical protein
MLAGEPSILIMIEEGQSGLSRTIGAPQIIHGSAACFF